MSPENSDNKDGTPLASNSSTSPGQEQDHRPIDTDALLARCMGSLSLAQNLLTELESTGSQRVDEIRKLAASADCNATANAAHSLKGAAAIMGAESLRDIAAQIEETGRAGTDAQFEELVHRLTDEMHRCLDFIPRIKEKTTDR